MVENETKLQEMYNKLSRGDKWRVQMYIWDNIQYPLIIKPLIENDLLPKKAIKTIQEELEEIHFWLSLATALLFMITLFLVGAVLML